jgi:hypothetical protein
MVVDQVTAMNLAAFKLSVPKAKPAAGLAPPLEALWWAAKGDWDKAHGIVMKQESADAAWVHAYLHRVEGDLDNAGYWYRRAKRAAASEPLETEWEAIAAALIDKEAGRK